MDDKLQGAINEQIDNEFFSAYLYLSMAAYCESVNLPGFAHWLKVQAKEELGHGMKFFDFMNDVGARVKLQAIKQPETEFKSAQEIFEKTLEHEKFITKKINDLYGLATQLKDNAALIAFQWFVTEQVEEEKNATHILETIKSIKGSSGGLVMLDHQLGKREG